MNKRDCYCKPGQLYCGNCMDCGKPGHASHWPGPVPATGTWCDACYVKEMNKWIKKCDLCDRFGHLKSEHKCHRCGKLGSHRALNCGVSLMIIQ